jgi:biopolymer transport protein ExbD
MTPMVDVTFLLLIFFMVTAAFSLQKSIQMPRQQSDAPSQSVREEIVEELDTVEVQIDERGTFLVLAEVDTETPSKKTLLNALRAAVALGGNEQKLVIKVHEACKLQALVDCMDAGTIAGFSQTQVSTVEEFD